MILAGDVGGTKTHLGIFSWDGKRPVAQMIRTYRSRAYASLEALVEGFLQAMDTEVDRACFGVPGPVIGERCEITNLPWVVDAHLLSTALGLPRVHLLNDLEATGWAIPILSHDDLCTLNEGQPWPGGAIAILAPGTGLGEGFLIWDGERYLPCASEGGHTDFAPTNPLEIRLLEYLAKRFGHVSYERVISGPGLFNIYSFLKQTCYAEEPAWLSERLSIEDPNKVVAEVALSGACELCVKALDVFVSILGSEAGNLVLKVLARGGLYLGGGIPFKILPKLKDGTFMEAFVRKGRFTSLLSQVPVYVILTDKAALLGAARFAYQN